MFPLAGLGAEGEGRRISEYELTYSTLWACSWLVKNPKEFVMGCEQWIAVGGKNNKRRWKENCLIRPSTTSGNIKKGSQEISRNRE